MQVERLIADGTTITERQAWLMRRLRAEATAQGLDVGINRSLELGGRQERGMWIHATMEKSRERRIEVVSGLGTDSSRR